MNERATSDSSELTVLRNRVAELEAKAAELYRDNEHLKRLYERAPLAYQSLDEEGNFIEVNQAWLDSLGYTREEVIGKNFAEFLHPDWQAHFRENFPRFKAIGEVLGVEFEMARKNGSFSLVSFHGRIGKDPHGRFQQTHCIFQDITEQRRTEQELQESELLLNISQRLTKSGGWQWDVAQEIMTWTEETYRIHDIDPRKVAQGSPEHIALSTACYTPEDQPKIFTAFQRCVERGEPYDLEFSFTTRKGRKLWIRTTAEAVWEDGRVARVRGNIQDITDRKLAELKLLEKELTLNTILNATPETISLIDTNGTILMANKTMASRFQRPVEELIGRSAYDFFPPNIALQRKVAIRQVVDTGLPVELVDDRDGLVLESHLWPVCDEAGRVSRIAVFARDITERKRMDEHLKISEEQFRLTFECSPVGMVMVAPNFKFLRINDSFCRLVGYSRNELKNLTFADITHPDDRQRDIEQVTRLLAGEIELYDLEKRYLHKSGETVWARVNVTLIRDQLFPVRDKI